MKMGDAGRFGLALASQKLIYEEVLIIDDA